MIELTSEQILQNLKAAYDPENLYPRLKSIFLLGTAAGWIRYTGGVRSSQRIAMLYPKQRKVEFFDLFHKGDTITYDNGFITHRLGEQLLASGRSSRVLTLNSGKPLKKIFWTRMDNIHFLGYAMINYFSFPFILEVEGVKITNKGFTLLPDKQDRRKQKELLELEITFPKTFYTHCAVQHFYIDPDTFLLDRIIYKVDMMKMMKGTATNFCYDYASYQGLMFPQKRRMLISKYEHLFYQKRIKDWKSMLLMYADIDDIQINLH